MVRTDNNPNCSSFERVFHKHKDMVYSIALAAVRTLTVRERLMRFLFGDKIKLTVIVPGNSVKGICIRRYRTWEVTSMKLYEVNRAYDRAEYDRVHQEQNIVLCLFHPHHYSSLSNYKRAAPKRKVIFQGIR